MVATNKGDRWFFVFGFEKNERSNISAAELKSLRYIAADLLNISPFELDKHAESGALREICHDFQN